MLLTRVYEVFRLNQEVVDRLLFSVQLRLATRCMRCALRLVHTDFIGALCVSNEIVRIAVDALLAIYEVFVVDI